MTVQIFHRLLCGIALLFCAFELVATVEISAAKHARMKLAVCPIGTGTHLADLVERVGKDLAFSQQFEVTTKSYDAVPSQEQMKAIGTPLALFIADAGRSLNWWLYDTLGPKMVKARRCTKRGSSWRWWAHNIADAVWPVLTGKDASFSSKLAYCKETRQASQDKRRTTSLCVADFDGTNERVVVDLPTVNVAPRWNRDTRNPLLFYSEHTRSNVRLMAVDYRGGRRVISNFDGMNMLPAFSSDGTKVVYGASRDDATCQLYLCEQNKLTKLTRNAGTNVSPALDAEGTTLFYCSDADSPSPQIYQLSLADLTCQRLTKTGFHASLSFNVTRGLLAYIKRVDGFMQLFTYDPKAQLHTQLTHDNTNKYDCSWSPCGNRLVFAIMRGGAGRLALLDIATKKQHHLTPAGVSVGYPSWSPLLATGFEPLDRAA